ncbi:MAG: hypothetical protein EXQ52_10695 [Bryobacterales bacterium]|nr:hypothetical protein [Bryobacterales bacterium]
MRIPALLLSLALPLLARDPLHLVLDRGLPVSNLNNASGDSHRSNVRWSSEENGFTGDDFRFGAPGERWVIDRIRTWAVPGNSVGDPASLGDYFAEVKLYFGRGEESLKPIFQGKLDAETKALRVTEATREGAPLYDDFGKFFRIWQLDFNNLDLAVEGGALYRFGVQGAGRLAPGGKQTYPWFNHGSNADLGEAGRDAADGRLLMFDAAGEHAETLDPSVRFWNKASDLNVQVFAHLAVDVALDGASATLLGSEVFDTGSLDVTTLRFGRQIPAGYKLADVNGDGRLDLTVQFPGALNGCLTGRRLDGVPFAGCRK